MTQQPVGAPSAAEIGALPKPEEAAVIQPLTERARVIGHSTSLLKRHVSDLLRRRLVAGLVLQQQYQWPPVNIYRLINVARRTFTNWYQRAEETHRQIPQMTEKAAREELIRTNQALDRWQPVLDEFVRLRTAMYRELMVAGKSEREIRLMLGLTRDQGRVERQRALRDGIVPPERIPDSAVVGGWIEVQIKNHADGYTTQLPGEVTLARQLTEAWGRRVDRSAVTLAYQALAKRGVVHSTPKVGWFVRRAEETDDDEMEAPTAACM